MTILGFNFSMSHHRISGAYYIQIFKLIINLVNHPAVPPLNSN